MDKTILTVSELNDYIKNLIDCDDMLAAVYVRGELSNYKIYPSGHHYFTMKDAQGALKCVMFRSSASRLRFRPENGMKVVAFGRVSVYPRDGVYQLYVSDLTVDGVGDLYIAFEQLKEKLLKEGLFDERFKKPLPRFPKRIAVITSGAGAAVRDIIRVLGARWPMAKVIVLPVRVQGAEAPAEIAGAIAYANRHKVADLIITGRGGGSIEDLWAFNEEIVARAIFASEIPVISAVGHEPDVTISDFVADVRAATPSNAAEIAVPDKVEMAETLLSYEIRAVQALRREITARRRKLEDLASRRVLVSPKNYLDDKRLLLDHAHARMAAAAERILAARKHRFAAQAAALDAMSPLKVLGRGYAIARKADGTVIKSAADVSPGDKITVRLQKDAFSATVSGAEPI
ncbi:MAG: exodeoxyribonuclease VII large subunit [Clostridiales bacterium]|nr:exodeoxyribonuclease VII large subunit [Clostridiales bacterium]